MTELVSQFLCSETEPTVSISMTVLKPFSERPEIGVKKFPAAPNEPKGPMWGISVSWETRIPHTTNNEVDPPKPFNGLRHSSFELFRFPNICLCRQANLSRCLRKVFSRSCQTFETADEKKEFVEFREAGSF